ncbi:MAG: hypothetical protein ACTHK7_09225 [Aureliella sp.]
MELRWQPSFDLSAMHAAWALASGKRFVDPALAEELAPAATELDRLARQAGVPASMFWRQLLALSAEFPSNEQLAERVLSRLQPGTPSASSTAELARAVAACEAVMRRRFPRMLEELALRVGPMQGVWEARGPGLLRMLGNITDPDFIVPSATISLVQPVVGGDGAAHLLTNRVHIEALLTDVDPRLPETLRLAWLLGQLNLDRPVYSENVHGHRLAEVAELALLPAIIHAAEELQVTQLAPQTIELALALWLRTPEERIAPLAEILMAWWETASAADWGWDTSLAALSKMLDG